MSQTEPSPKTLEKLAAELGVDYEFKTDYFVDRHEVVKILILGKIIEGILGKELPTFDSSDLAALCRIIAGARLTSRGAKPNVANIARELGKKHQAISRAVNLRRKRERLVNKESK